MRGGGAAAAAVLAQRVFLRGFPERRSASSGTYAKTRVGVFLGEGGRGGRPSRSSAATAQIAPAACAAACAPRSAAARREEHAGQELPVVGGAAGVRTMPSATWSTWGRSARPTAPTATRSRPSAPARGCAARRTQPRAAWSSPRARSDQPAAAECRLGARCRGLRPRWPPRPHQQRGDPRRHLPDDGASTSRAHRDHRQHLPRPRHAHRDRGLRRRRATRCAALHAAGRRGDATDTAAEARSPGCCATRACCARRSSRATGQSARSSCSSCSRSTTRSRCGATEAATGACG